MNYKTDYPNIYNVFELVKEKFPEYVIELSIKKNYGKFTCNGKRISGFDASFYEVTLATLGKDAIMQAVSTMIIMIQRKFILAHYKRKGGHGSNAFNITPNLLKFARANSRSVSGAARFLGVCDNTFRKYAMQHGIYDGMANMSGAGISKGYKSDMYSSNLDDIFANKYPGFPLKVLKKRMLSQYLIEEKCNICGYDKIRKRDFASPLDLKFKDKKNDYSIDNLHLVCKNCQYVMDDRYRFIYIYDRKLKEIQELKVRDYDKIWEEYNAALRKNVIAKNPDSVDYMDEDVMNEDAIKEIIDADSEQFPLHKRKSKKEDENNPDTSGASSIWKKWNK